MEWKKKKVTRLTLQLREICRVDLPFFLARFFAFFDKVFGFPIFGQLIFNKDIQNWLQHVSNNVEVIADRLDSLSMQKVN